MNKEIEITFRKLRLTDDLEKVAELIYNTDPYIFPYEYEGNLDKAKAILVNMIKGDTLYNYENIYVAISGETIVGMIVAARAPLSLKAEPMMDCYLKADAVVDGRFKKVYKEYYELLNDEPDGIYIANVCVDKFFRGQGIGKKMLTAFLRDDETYNLETVKANESAFALYTSMGFEMQYEYPGFTAVPCYRMTRKKKC